MGAGASAGPLGELKAVQPVAAESSPMVRQDCREALRETKAFPHYLECWVRALKPLSATAFQSRQDFLMTKKQWHARLIEMQQDYNKELVKHWEPKWVADDETAEREWTEKVHGTALSDVHALWEEGIVDLCLRALTKYKDMYTGFDRHRKLKQRARPIYVPSKIPYYVSQRYYAPFRNTTTESMKAALCRCCFRILAGVVIDDRIVVYMHMVDAISVIEQVVRELPVEERVHRYAELIREGLRGYNHPVEAIGRYRDAQNMDEILHLMREHSKVFRVQQAGLRAIQELIEELGMGEVMASGSVSSEMIETLGAPLIRYRPRVQLHVMAASIVRSLAEHDEDLCGTLGRLGLVDALMLALRDCRGFVSVAERDEGIPSQAKSSAKRAGYSLPEVAQHCLWALEALHRVGLNRDKMVAHGIPHILREIEVDNKNVGSEEVASRYIVLPRRLKEFDWQEQQEKVSAAIARNREAAWQQNYLT